MDYYPHQSSSKYTITLLFFSWLSLFLHVCDGRGASAANPVSLSSQASKDQLTLQPRHTDPVTGMEFVLVPGGCFQMGNIFSSQSTSSINLLSNLFWFLNLANPSDFGDVDELPVHEVCLDSFYIGKYEVTQYEFQLITGNNPSIFRHNQRPVESISWHDANLFASRLSELSGKRYHLPTEAQWEYAARSAGTEQLYAGSRDFRSVAEIKNKEGRGTYLVGQKSANSLGVHDMSGNVWEWCSDWYNQYYYHNSPKNNPFGPLTGEQRVLRGGGWNSYPRQIRTVNRRFIDPEVKNMTIGFRLVLQVDNNEK